MYMLEKEIKANWKEREGVPKSEYVILDKFKTDSKSASGIMAHLKGFGSDGWFDLSYFDKNDVKEISKEMFEKSMNEIVKQKIQNISEFKEKYISAFIAETGFKPSEIEIVETRNSIEKVFYVRKKSEDSND